MRSIRSCFAIVLLGCVARLIEAADDPATAAAKASLARLEALRKERAGDGLLVFYEAITRLRLGERERALELLQSLKGRKLGLIPLRDSGFETIWEEPQFQKIRAELAGEEAETPAAPIAFRLSDPKLIPEGIAHATAGDQFFIGSIAQRKIVVTDKKGAARDFSKSSDKLDAVLGLAVDGERGHLYAVSTNGFLDEAKKERRNWVARYDLKTEKLLDRFDAPDALQLNDVVIAPDGTLYATDSGSGTLFRRKRDEATLTPLGEKGDLRGANGIALATDGALYVTLSTGIARVDPTTGKPSRLPQPDSVVTGGIDGLYWDKGDLIGIQNSTNPGRVVRIRLEDKGNRIAGLTVLQSHHHPDFAEPTTGVIANGKLHVIANSYIGHYQPDGTLKDGDALKGTAIVAVPLNR
jgi:sugar lactone lactonase YvrE